MLKAEKIDLALLEAKYGFVTPPKVLQALQRDGIQGKADVFQEDIYEKPMVEVIFLLQLKFTFNISTSWCSNIVLRKVVLPGAFCEYRVQ